MNPSVDVGNPPRSFRHLRMTERRTPDPSSSRVPVHSALVQKSVTVITNPAGRLSLWMLGELLPHSKSESANSWQTTCNQSNPAPDSPLAIPPAILEAKMSGRPPRPSSRAQRGVLRITAAVDWLGKVVSCDKTTQRRRPAAPTKEDGLRSAFSLSRLAVLVQHFIQRLG